MRVLHVHLNGPFTENWSYQENHLSEEHKRMGHDVTVITNCYTFNDKGVIVETEPTDKILNNGVRLIRVKKYETIYKKYNDVFRPYHIFKLIDEIKPDYIINHGLIGSVAAFDVIKYVKKNINKTTLVADIHEDYYVGQKDNTLKLKILRSIRRNQNKKLLKYSEAIFCINPDCMLYAENYYNIPKAKLEILPIGSDYHLINELEENDARNKVRKELGISSNEIVICHGGKLDTKKRTIELIDAMVKLREDFSIIKLVIFGPVLEDINESFFTKIEKQSFISYLGQLSKEEFYQLLIATDICVFPGTDSALWIQAISCGNALAITREHNADYLNLGGNIEIMNSYESSDIYNSIKSLILNKKYMKMRMIAKKNAEKLFSYEQIAKKTLKYLKERK